MKKYLKITLILILVISIITLIIIFFNNKNIKKSESITDYENNIVDSTNIFNDVNDEEWYLTYTKIIEDTTKQKDDANVYFREIYIADGYELPLDGAGGVSAGYPLINDNLLFYLQDITTDLDDIPELFIGIDENNKTKILAIYTFNTETHIASSVSTLSLDYNPEIYLCKNNLILEGNTTGGELIMIGKSGRMPFAAFRQGQDEETIIRPEEMGWKDVLEW